MHSFNTYWNGCRLLQNNNLPLVFPPTTEAELNPVFTKVSDRELIKWVSGLIDQLTPFIFSSGFLLMAFLQAQIFYRKPIMSVLFCAFEATTTVHQNDLHYGKWRISVYLHILFGFLFVACGWWLLCLNCKQCVWKEFRYKQQCFFSQLRL